MQNKKQSFLISFPNESKFYKCQSYEFSREVYSIARRKQEFFNNFVNESRFQVYAYISK